MEHIPLRLRKLRAKNAEYLQMSKVANNTYLNTYNALSLALSLSLILALSLALSLVPSLSYRFVSDSAIFIAL